MVEATDRDLIMKNFNVFRALVFQNIIYPEFLNKKKSIVKNDKEISTLVECLNDSSIFLNAQKRFGYKTADPKELKKKGVFKLLPLKGPASYSKMANRQKKMIKQLTKKFGFSFDDHENKPKSPEMGKQNSYKGDSSLDGAERGYKGKDYFKMISLKSMEDIREKEQMPILRKIEEDDDISDNEETSFEGNTHQEIITPDESSGLDSFTYFRKKQMKAKPSKFKSITKEVEFGSEGIGTTIEPKSAVVKLSKTGFKTPLRSNFRYKYDKPLISQNKTITDCLSLINNNISSREQGFISLQKKLRSASPKIQKFSRNDSYKRPTCASTLRTIKGIVSPPSQLQKFGIENCNWGISKKVSFRDRKARSPGVKNIEEMIWIKKMKRNNYLCS